MSFKIVGMGVLLTLIVVYMVTLRAPYRQVNAMNYNTLTSAEQRVILGEGTERAFSGMYHDFDEKGIYTCKQCDRPLFESDAKFKSGTGWPSFDDAIAGAIREVSDGSRVEIECDNCGGHIGHVFRGESFTAKSTRHCANSIALNFVTASNEKSAIFAGGCFWGVEHHLEAIPGVLSATSGYVGGRTHKPTYKEVSYENTGHAEAVQVVYDASKVSYETIAKMFFEIHDSTQVNRQGPDIGDQYRSAVFYADDEQRETAQKLIDLLKSKGLKVATELRPAGTFWDAEDYHQDYYANNGKTPYCHTWKKLF
jgi:peptide methionine sulfoxide reductase msrA/msrB